MSSVDNKKFLLYVILSQCFGRISALCFNNGVLFSYFDNLNCGESNLIILLKMPSIVSLLIILPLAFLADRHGKKKLGQAGNGIQALGVGLLISAPWFPGYELIILYAGVVVFASGSALFDSSWFSLLDPLISKGNRGPFFARMRTCWKLAAVFFLLFAQYMMNVDTKLILGQLTIILIVVFAFSVLRMFFYQRIPDVERPVEDHHSKKFLGEMKSMLSDKPFRKYTIYRFAFPLLVGSTALIFNLYEKKFMGFEAGDFILMGNLMFIGSLAGFYIGALMNKKWVERKVFMITAVGMTLCGLAFPLHGYVPVPPLIYASVITFIFGCISAAYGISCTSLMLGLLQPERKSLASSFCIAVTQLGIAFSGLIAAALVKMDWGLPDTSGFSNIYSIILVCSFLPLPIVTWWLTNDLKSRS